MQEKICIAYFFTFQFLTDLILRIKLIYHRINYTKIVFALFLTTLLTTVIMILNGLKQ